MGLYKRFLLKGALAGAIITTMVGVGAILFNTQHTQATSSFDCDNNAVLYCGASSVGSLISKYDNQDAPGPKYTDIPAIYNFFGISSTGIHSLSTKVSMGQVHKDGTVWMNGKQIGNGAMTAGRVNFAGSTPIPGTHAFMRPPSVSFASSSLDAYIGYTNGEPAWAVLVSCGNPVKFQRPHISIAKTVQNSQGVFGESATFNNGDHIRYKLVVTNTGQATATNVLVADLLPAGQTYDKGSTKVNGANFQDGIQTTSAINIGSLAPGASATVSFTATVNLPNTQCTLKTMTNLGLAAADNVGLVSDSAKASAKVNCVGKCVSLTAPDYSLNVGQKVTFTATTMTKNVTIKNIVFKVDGQVVQNTASDKTYVFMSNTASTHTVTVTVHFSDGTVDGGDGTCAKQVTVKPLPPVVSCVSLTPSKTEVVPGEQIVFKAVGSAKNTTIQSYIFKVDGVVKQNTGSDTYNFTQTQDGTYVVSVTIHPARGEDVTSPECKKQVTVKTPPHDISCVSLTASKTEVLPGEQVTFKATGKTTNANILTYAFSVNGNVVQNTSSDTYIFSQTADGTYTLSVNVHTDHGDATSPACTKQVIVKKVVSPVPTCDLLSVDKTSINVGDTITATAAFSAPTGVTFKQANFHFGDEADATQTTASTQLDSNGNAVATHAYNKVGDYNLTVSIDFMVDGSAKNGVTSDKCTAKVTVGAVLTSTTPTQLINTGPGDIAGIFAGTSLIGALAHRRWTLRKSAK